MLQPRETDLPALFLVLVVLPLVAYILLGKWSEVANKKDRISKLAQIAAEEAFRADAMAAATVMPVMPTVQMPLVPLSNNGVHECARCYGPATTRCSRCKSVRYCSGKCQIIHWRQVHKHECQNLENNGSKASPLSGFNEDSFHENFLQDESMDLQFFESNVDQSCHEKISSDDIYRPPVSTVASPTAASMTMEAPGHMMKRKPIDKRGHRRSKSNREILNREEGARSESAEEAFWNRPTCSTSYNTTSKDTFIRHKFKESYSVQPKEGISEKTDINIPGGPNRCAVEMGLMDGGSLHRGEMTSSNEAARIECSSERTSMKRSNTVKTASQYPVTKMHKLVKSAAKASRDPLFSDMEKRGQVADELKVARMKDTNPAQGGNGVANMGFMKMIGLMRSSKQDRLEQSEYNGDRHKKIKMLFPYEEFVKFFQYEVFDLLPRGLVNCGNSCYANAVLQCLTCTKPLTIYLLNRSHSRACCVKDWCLMCELEQHVTMLRESGGPLSLSKILLHMRSVNCQIGDGSQEDAHEFLRLLVTSMQSICLERLGGEDVVDPRLQETTFIQHTFGGRLRSKVKCLRCHHESERYENIMDLTLEIYGWVESLEDALTQFTSPEDLDGENMYRCGRCATYVRAQKQLGIQEAPNILTIVLKRFQEGSYGKINKCITFPDMLDMIPFMIGADDIPPLYMLYGVVVHLDTLNASFSGHYVSYVKDLQGSWFRIDDTEVQPVSLSQVMSEGAYILFYTRSSPRPSRGHTEKPTRQKARGFPKHWTSKTPKSSSDHRQEMMGIHRSSNRNRSPMTETYNKPSSMDFSDATSSDWSIFTSSDDASFTTESTRDSFSTVDYADACNDPISSIFNNLYTPKYLSQQTVSCSRFSSSRPHTRFVSEAQPPYRLHKDRGENGKHVRVSSTEAFPSGSNCGVYVKYESNHKDVRRRTSGL